MTESEMLAKMIAPGQLRPSKPYRGGVIQIHVTRACNLSCWACTQGSNLGGKLYFMPPQLFEQAVLSLKGYFGVVGVFGGNPAMSPHFADYCEILRQHVPFEQCGLWCNHPRSMANAQAARATFNPGYSNLNVHMDQEAFDLFKRGWPESRPFGLHDDSRHSPPFVAMKDVVLKGAMMEGEMGLERTSVPDDDRIRELISRCDINQHWSAMIGMFRGQLRAWFCEIAGAQSILHQDEPDYPDTGMEIEREVPGKVDEWPVTRWWQLKMDRFANQVRKHCWDCGVPLKGYGELSQADRGTERVSRTHADVYKPKRTHRPVEVVTELVQLQVGKLRGRFTDYMTNAVPASLRPE